MRHLVRAFPVVPGRLDDVLRFARECSERGAEVSDFYTRYGIMHESWHLQEYAGGHLVIGITILEDLDRATPEYAASTHPFDAWFKQRVNAISGIDPNLNPQGPPTTEVFRYDASS